MDFVHLCISTEHGDDVQLSALVVLLIYDPLQNQPIVHANVTRAHLRGLKLADYSTDEDDVIVDKLVGSDQYWQLVSGKVLGGENGPTAVQTKLGWVLSGPTNGAVQNDQRQNNLMTTHVLRTAKKPVDNTNESLDGSLRRFWDLDTGPPLEENILDILLRFRVSRIALTGDVEKAFLMISIAEEDRGVLSFCGWMTSRRRTQRSRCKG